MRLGPIGADFVRRRAGGRWRQTRPRLSELSRLRVITHTKKNPGHEGRGGCVRCRGKTRTLDDVVFAGELHDRGPVPNQTKIGNGVEVVDRRSLPAWGVKSLTNKQPARFRL